MNGGDRRMLAERARLEQERLDRIEALLLDTEVTAQLGQAVGTTLRQLLAKQRSSYGTSGAVTELDWSGLNRRVRAGDRVLAECLAVVAGAFTRSIPRLADECAEAQSIAAELSQLTLAALTHDVVLADTECAGMASSIVRRRFPDHGIWDLPVIAHEFGHLVVRDLLDVNPLSGDQSHPLADFLAGRDAQLAELAADVFAVFVIGPAYVLTLVLHRMDPTGVAVSPTDASHPGDPSRVEAALHVLALLGSSDACKERRDQYAFLLESLRDWWALAQESAPDEARLTKLQAARVRKQAEDVWNKLMGSKLVDARYQSFLRARSLADGLDKGATPGVTSTAGTSGCDVLNAVWLVRFRAWRDGREMPAGLEAWGRAELARLRRDPKE